jgi:hypothetical protein
MTLKYETDPFGPADCNMKEVAFPILSLKPSNCFRLELGLANDKKFLFAHNNCELVRVLVSPVKLSIIVDRSTSGYHFTSL